VAGNSSICTSTVTVLCNSISGRVLYAGDTNRPIYNSTNEVQVTLVDNNQNTVLGPISVTSLFGDYEFKPVPDGDYSVNVDINYGACGINGTDASIALNEFVFPNQLALSPIQLLAAETGGPTGINAVDALAIAQFFVQYINEFTDDNGNVLSTWVQIQESITINGTNINNDIPVLIRGDINASCDLDGEILNLTNGSAQKREDITIEPFGTIELYEVGQEIEIPIMIGSDIDIKAISLALDFSANVLDITSVSLGFDLASNNLVYSIKDNHVRIAWFNLESFELGKNEPLIYLHAKVNKEFTQAAPFMECSSLSDSELANGYDEVIENVTLKMPSINNTSSDHPLLENHSFQFEVYPNPVQDNTIVEYFSPEKGSIYLQLFNQLGQEIKSISTYAEFSGNQQIELNVKDLNAGIYLIRLTYKDGNQFLTSTKKIIVQ